MDFHGMKRKELQMLCKKHEIPANLKNIEMATRLASVFETEKEETLTDMKSLPEDSVVLVVGIKDSLVLSKEAKKVRLSLLSKKKKKRVRFSPDIEVFEFTRSIKKRQLKNVRKRSQGTDQDLQKGGIELRRSKRIGSRDTTQQGCKVTELMGLEQSKELSGNNQDDFQLEKVGIPSTRLIALLTESCVGGGTSKAGTLLLKKRSKRLVDVDKKEEELVKNNVKEVSVDFEVQERGKYHSKDVQDDPKVELKAHGASDSEPLCSVTESKEEIKTKQSKRSLAVKSQEGVLIKNKTKKLLIDCEVQTTENYPSMKVQDVSKVEKVPRRSKRLGNDVSVLIGKRSVKAVKHDDLEVENAPKLSRQLEKSVNELTVHGQAKKSDWHSKRTSRNDPVDKKLLRSLKCSALDHMLDQGMSNSPKSCPFIDCERDGPSVYNMKELNVNDELQVSVRFTRNSSRDSSYEAPIVVEGNLVEKKTDETLDSLVKSSKRVARRMKRDISTEPGMDIETASTQKNQNNEAKKVRSSFENEVYEFTRSIKKREVKNVRMRSQGTDQVLEQCGMELRRSKRIRSRGSERCSGD